MPHLGVAKRLASGCSLKLEYPGQLASATYWDGWRGGCSAAWQQGYNLHSKSKGAKAQRHRDSEKTGVGRLTATTFVTTCIRRNKAWLISFWCLDSPDSASARGPTPSTTSTALSFGSVEPSGMPIFLKMPVLACLAYSSGWVLVVDVASATPARKVRDVQPSLLTAVIICGSRGRHIRRGECRRKGAPIPQLWLLEPKVLFPCLPNIHWMRAKPVPTAGHIKHWRWPNSAHVCQQGCRKGTCAVVPTCWLLLMLPTHAS